MDKEANNLYWQNQKISRQDRERLSGHDSFVIWFTGLSGSGKSTLSQLVEVELYQRGLRTIVLDGDNFRHGISSNLGFSKEDRFENLRRVGEVGKLFLEAGTITLAAFISPFENDRAYVKGLVGAADFVAVYCKCGLEVCETRDVKGIYKKVRSGEIKNFTGINSPYEEPENPDIVVETDKLSIEESVNLVLTYIENRFFKK